MITFLSVFAVYGIFDVLHTFLFSEPICRNIRKAVILDNINDENIEYYILKYKRDGYEVIISADGKYKNNKIYNDDKIHILKKEIFTQYFEKS